MDLFAKKTAKDKMRIPAELYNLVVDAVRFYMQSRPDRKSEKIGVQGPTRFGIKNVSGSTLEQYAVVGIGAGLAVPGGDDTYYFGDAYFDSAAPAAASPFAILQDTAANTGYAPAITSGASFVRVNYSDVSHGYAAPSAGVYTHLVSQAGVGPATILWKETGTNQLNGGINNSVTHITVDSGADFPDVPFVITIETEDLNVTATRGETLLNGTIDDATTTVVVDSASDFPTATPFVIVIGTERMNVTAGGGTTTWTVTRGHQNSTADQHSDNDPVTAAADTYWTVTRGHNSTSAASHADNTALALKTGTVWAMVNVDARTGIVAGDLNGYRQAGTTVDVYYPGGNITGGFLTYYTAKDLIHCVSFIVPNTITLDEIAVWLQTNGAAGKKCRLAIYDSPSQTDIFPDQLIVDSGEIAIDSGAAGYKTAAINVTLTGGKNYWLCYVSNDNVGTLGGTNQTFMSPIFGMSKTSFAEKFGLITTFTYGAFPSTYPGTASDLSGGPFIIPVVHLSG